VQRIADVLSQGHLGLVALGMYGLGLTLWRRSAKGALVLAWLLSAVLSLAVYTPIWYHHATLILLPLAIAAGMGVSQLIRFAQSHRLWTWADGVCITLGAEAVVVFLLFMPQTHREIAQSVTWPQPEAWAAVEDLHALVQPGDYVITDYPIMAFRAGLFVPPDLTDLGLRRIRAGEVTMADLLVDIERYQPSAVVMWREVFPEDLPEFVDWVDENYFLAHIYDVERRIYVDLPPTPQHPMHVDLGGQVTFLGYSAPERVRPGETLVLVLYWRAQQPMQVSYSVFNHLLDAAGADSVSAGQLRAQRDGLPVGGRHPTTAWVPDDVVADLYEIAIPPDLPPGQYTLQSGMYELASLRRLPVANQPGEDAIRLGTILVVP